MSAHCRRVHSRTQIHNDRVAALHQGAPGQMTWLEDPPPWLPPCLLLCFASVIVWTENKNLTISDRCPLCLFYFDSETILAALAAIVLWGRRLEKGRQLFWGKKCIRVTWLEDVLTSKWLGSFTALAPSQQRLHDRQALCNKKVINDNLWRIKGGTELYLGALKMS